MRPGPTDRKQPFFNGLAAMMLGFYVQLACEKVRFLKNNTLRLNAIEDYEPVIFRRDGFNKPFALILARARPR